MGEKKKEKQQTYFLTLSLLDPTCLQKKRGNTMGEEKQKVGQECTVIGENFTPTITEDKFSCKTGVSFAPRAEGPPRSSI